MARLRTRLILITRDQHGVTHNTGRQTDNQYVREYGKRKYPIGDIDGHIESMKLDTQMGMGGHDTPSPMIRRDSCRGVNRTVGVCGIKYGMNGISLDHEMQIACGSPRAHPRCME